MLSNLSSALYDRDLWPSDVQSWQPHVLTPWTTCASWHQNRLIHFQNIVFISLVYTVNEQMSKWTGWEHYAPTCQSGLVETWKLIYIVINLETYVQNLRKVCMLLIICWSGKTKGNRKKDFVCIQLNVKRLITLFGFRTTILCCS